MAFIQIDKQNFYHNLNQIALKTGSVDKIAIVLKDNAYGHGLEIMAQLASEFGIGHAVVKNVEEAAAVKSLFRTVLVLSDTIVEDNVCSFAVNRLADLETAQRGAKVELKVDTGMHRNGIAMHEIDEALKLIGTKQLKLVGVMTHFRSADELGSELFWQQKQFESVKKKIVDAGITDVRFHSHNSAAILRSRHFHEDLVRVGIGAYGYSELPSCYEVLPLKPVMSLYAVKNATRTLKKGERIGYGGDYTAAGEMRVSTYDLGYGDGWCRGDSRKPYVTAEGLPLLGRVSMDFISLETDKEKVCIFDNAQEAARQFGTISYEITTALSRDIPREVV
jgi:alanine racemase